MSIKICLSIYISIYTLIEMIWQLLPSSKAQIPLIRPTTTEIQSFRFTMKQNVCILTGSLKVRTGSFVGKRGEIQVLKSMTKFAVALKETCFTLGVLQLISMAGRSTVIYLASHSPHKLLGGSLLLVNSKLFYPYYNSKRAHTVLSMSERVHQCKNPGFCYLIPYAWSEAPFDLGSPSFQNCVRPFNSGFTLRHIFSLSFSLPESLRFM